MPTNAELNLHAGELPVAGIKRVADRLLLRAEKLIEHSSADRDEDVHTVRTSMKKVRALLRLLRPMMGEAAFRRENGVWHRAARRLAHSRDLIAGGGTLQWLAREAKSDCERIAFALVSERYRQLVTAEDPKVREEALRLVEHALHVGRRRIGELRVATDGWEAIAAGLEQVYRACRNRMEEAFGKGGDETAFHRWRIRLKNLLFELQLLSPIAPKRIGQMVKTLTKLQSLAGDTHDLHVLECRLRSAPDEFGGKLTVKVVTVRIGKVRRKLRRKAQKLGEDLFTTKPARFVEELRLCWEEWTASAKVVRRKRGRTTGG